MAAGLDHVEEEFSVWKRNTPFLYDLMISHPLEWPSLTLHWVLSKPIPYAKDPYFAVHKLILGTHTSGGAQDFLMVADVIIPTPDAEPGLGSKDQEPIVPRGSFGEIVKAYWRRTPVGVKCILPSLSDDRLVIQDFRHEVDFLVKLRHPNIVQFLGAVTERKPLILITEYLRGGDLHQYLKEKGGLTPETAVNFALDIARGMTYLHNEIFAVAILELVRISAMSQM